MANPNIKDTTPVATPASANVGSFLKREMSGATFLTLEHVGHMALVVIVTILVAVGFITALSLWTGNVGIVSMMPELGAHGAKYVEASMAISIVAALLVLVPMLAVLDRRTRAEWLKRPGYAARVAYKAPVYTALGVLVVGKTAAVIQMVSVVLSSLALIGVSGSDIGGMYLSQFLSALLVTIIFGASGWYVFKLAKGRDNGQTFSMAMVVVGTMLAIALFITAIVTFHNSTNTSQPTRGSDYFNEYRPGDSKDLEKLFPY